MTEVKICLAGFNPNVFSVFHLNITSTKKRLRELHKTFNCQR